MFWDLSSRRLWPIPRNGTHDHQDAAEEPATGEKSPDEMTILEKLKT